MNLDGDGRPTVAGAVSVDSSLGLDDGIVSTAQVAVTESWEAPAPVLGLLRYDPPGISNNQSFGLDWIVTAVDFGMVLVKDADSIPVHCLQLVEKLIGVSKPVDIIPQRITGRPLPESIQGAFDSKLVYVHHEVSSGSFASTMQSLITRHVMKIERDIHSIVGLEVNPTSPTVDRGSQLPWL